MKPKYTAGRREDGLGGQLKTLAALINFAEKYDMYVICDIRAFSYFLKANKTFALERDAGDLIDFHPRIVYDFDHIDSIPAEEIFDWRDPAIHDSIMEWATGGKHKLIKSRREAWMYIADNKDKLKPPPNPDEVFKMPIRIKDRLLIEKYKTRVQNSISVHARLGNGEQDMMETTTLYLTTATRKRHGINRLSVNRDDFILEMKKHKDHDFFICTDTLSFFEQCKDVFGDRAYCINRDWPPPGCGPGHNITGWPYPEDIKQRWRGESLDPWKFICEGLIDMELMCESKHLICNNSQFNHFPRLAQSFTKI